MARVTALIPDLLFGSKVVAMLEQAGHEVDLVDNGSAVWDEIAGTDLLIADLTTDELDPVVLIESLQVGGEMVTTKTLGFYSHVEADVKRDAEEAGFDLVVPRSRMAREGAAVVAGLVGADS
jgi:CheY-like chemotaxis protein